MRATNGKRRAMAMEKKRHDPMRRDITLKRRFRRKKAADASIEEL